MICIGPIVVPNNVSLVQMSDKHVSQLKHNLAFSLFSKELVVGFKIKKEKVPSMFSCSSLTFYMADYSLFIPASADCCNSLFIRLS